MRLCRLRLVDVVDMVLTVDISLVVVLAVEDLVRFTQ